MPSRSRIRTQLARLLPKGLAARLTLTIVMTNLVVLLSALVFIALAVRVYVPTLRESYAQAALSQISQGLDDQAAAIDISLTPFETSQRMRDAGLSASLPDDLVATLDAYARRIGAIAVVFTDNSGNPLYSYGQPEDVAVLQSALPNLLSSLGPGALRIGGLAAVAASRPIVGTGTGEPAGSIAVAREFVPAELHLSGSLSLGHPEGSTLRPDDAHVIESPPFNDVNLGSTADGFFVEAEVPGVDGRPAATLEYDAGVALLPEMASFWTLALAGLAGALVFGTVVGLLVARAIARPIVDVATRMETYGADAREGRHVEHVPEDALLPLEFNLLQESLFRAFTDLAEHQEALARATAEAEAANAALDVAVHDSLEGKVVVSDGVVTLVNPAAAAHLGLPPIGKDASAVDLFSSEEMETEDGEPIDPNTLLDRSMTQPQTLRVLASGRSARWIELRSVPHDTGQHMLLITTRDITEQRRLDDLRNEILGLVSHDLRAPLTVMTGYLDLLARQTDDPTMTKAVTSAQRSAYRMQELLEDLLSATRAEEMFAPTELARVSLRELAEEIVVSFQHTSPHDLKLAAESDGVVMGEEKRLRQVMVNLITNAMKYSPTDTAIDITLGCDAHTVVLAVEDRGPGVPETERERVFERFARLSPEDGSRHPGVGLGLYIVRAIVESHGGKVNVESREEGPGARFVVSLPLARPIDDHR